MIKATRGIRGEQGLVHHMFHGVRHVAAGRVINEGVHQAWGHSARRKPASALQLDDDWPKPGFYQRFLKVRGLHFARAITWAIVVDEALHELADPADESVDGVSHKHDRFPKLSILFWLAELTLKRP